MLNLQSVQNSSPEQDHLTQVIQDLSISPQPSSSENENCSDSSNKSNPALTRSLVAEDLSTKSRNNSLTSEDDSGGSCSEAVTPPAGASPSHDPTALNLALGDLNSYVNAAGKVFPVTRDASKSDLLSLTPKNRGFFSECESTDLSNPHLEDCETAVNRSDRSSCKPSDVSSADDSSSDVDSGCGAGGSSSSFSTTTETASAADTADNEYQYLRGQVILPPPPDPGLTFRLASWLSRMQKQGFSAESLRAFMDETQAEEEEGLSEVEDDQCKNCWWDESVIRVFDPYRHLSIGCRGGKDDLVEAVLDGKTNSSGDLVGQCTLKLRNGDEVYGTFRRGVRQGRGSISGDNMARYGLTCVRGSYRDGVLQGEGRAILSPSPVFGVNRGSVTLEGIFNRGFLEGPVRGIDEKGNLLFIGLYYKGLPYGPCWIAREGQGWLHGNADPLTGRLTGDEIAFVYPDLSTAILGTYHNEKLVSGMPAQVTEASLSSVSDPVVRLGFVTSEPPSQSVLDQVNTDVGRDSVPEPLQTVSVSSPSLRYSYAPSDRQRIACNWKLADCYETATVLCRQSDISGANDGLFAARDIPKGTVISYYNGVRVLPGESYTTTSYSYQIYVDWVNTDDSPFIDIPMACVDIQDYFASLAHKANHSFDPNCRFVASDHPVFGRVPSLQTIKDVVEGEELMSHYKYDTALAPTWYQEAWARFTEGPDSANTSSLAFH